MRDRGTTEHLDEIADSFVPLRDRAQAMLGRLGSHVTFDAAWMAVMDARLRVAAVVATSGLDRPTSELVNRLVSTSTGTEVQALLGSDTFRSGLTVELREPSGQRVGLVGLLFRSAEPQAAVMREGLDGLAPSMARGLSPMRSLRASAHLVAGAKAGVVLLHGGGTCALPGLEGHVLLQPESPTVGLAGSQMAVGQVSRSFMWPTPVPGHEHAHAHARLTVVCATDMSDLVGGVLVVEPDADSRGLTARELEVLGLLVDGRSNQEIARGLRVAPRTVATHVEHVMRKLDAPSRTLAAVRAEQEGCYVPPWPDSTKQLTRPDGTPPVRSRPPSP